MHLYNRYRLLQIILLGFGVMGFAANAGTNLLAIHSYHNEHIWTGFIKDGIDQSFNSQEGAGLFHEYLDAKRYPNLEFKEEFLTYLEYKYMNTSLDVILVSDDAALQLIRKNRQRLFPDVPIVYMGINKVSQDLIDTPNMTGVFENRDLAGTVFDIKRITKSEDLIVITDQSAPGRANLSKIKAIEGDPRAPTNLHIIDDLNDEKIVETLQIFDAPTPVLLIGQMTSPSQNNALLSWNEGTRLITTLTVHPVFTIAITTLEYGATGADELHGNRHAQRASNLAKQVLQGVPISEISPITKARSQWFFDAQSVKHHGFGQEDLPKDSLMINQDVSFYDTYKVMVWIVSATFALSILIILMLIEIIRRGTHTRRILSENESRYKDLAKAGANVFWETDNQHQFSYLSGNTGVLFSRPAGKIVGETLVDLYKQDPRIDFPWGRYEQQLAAFEPINNIIFKIKSESKELKIFLLNGNLIHKDGFEFAGYRGIFKEITEEHVLSQKLAYQASYDSLTGLINRANFNAKLKNYVEQHHESAQKAFICFLDLDRFKLVNDTAGHLIGDSMLSEIASLIDDCIDPLDILGRLGGDEFGLLLVNKNQAEARLLCETIVRRVSDYKFHWNNLYFDVGISIGVVPVSNDLTEIELLSKADLSCYKAKEMGRGKVYIADLDNRDLYHEELQMGYIVNVTQAIEQDQFYLVKQLVKPTTERDIGYDHYEILIRYKDDQGNVILPGLFIPAAEKHSVITLIDQWVLATILNRYDEFFPHGKTLISINLSGISLSNEDFVENVISLLKSSSLDPTFICFEITETAAISHLSHALEFIRQMKGLGIKFALDDFGSGAASFEYLKNIPVDYLKIDGSLIRNIVTEPIDRAIVESIHAIARMMGIQTIAEFVENDEIHAVLDQIGLDCVQGYGIGIPVKC